MPRVLWRWTPGRVRPDISPRAAGHIPEIIALVLKLIEKGHAYESNGSVYFDVSTFPEYGKLSHREVTAASEEESRVGQEEKRHPADFAIWKRADPEHILQWPSPWGMGFPAGTSSALPWRTRYWAPPWISRRRDRTSSA